MIGPENDPAFDPEVGPELDEDGPASLRDRLRAKREEMRQSRTLDLVVPGYDGMLGVRYRAIPSEEFQAMVRKVKKGDGANLIAACRLVGRCCEALLERATDEEPFRILVDDAEQAITFDSRLATLLGFEAEKAQDVIMETFSPGRKRDLAVFTHADALIDWMRGREAEIDQVLLGE